MENHEKQILTLELAHQLISSRILSSRVCATCLHFLVLLGAKLRNQFRNHRSVVRCLFGVERRGICGMWWWVLVHEGGTLQIGVTLMTGWFQQSGLTRRREWCSWESWSSCTLRVKRHSWRGFFGEGSRVTRGWRTPHVLKLHYMTQFKLSFSSTKKKTLCREWALHTCTCTNNERVPVMIVRKGIPYSCTTQSWCPGSDCSHNYLCSFTLRAFVAVRCLLALHVLRYAAQKWKICLVRNIPSHLYIKRIVAWGPGTFGDKKLVRDFFGEFNIDSCNLGCNWETEERFFGPKCSFYSRPWYKCVKQLFCLNHKHDEMILQAATINIHVFLLSKYYQV